MRHLKTMTLGVGPTDLIPSISTNITALSDCPIKWRAFSPRRPHDNQQYTSREIRRTEVN